MLRVCVVLAVGCLVGSGAGCGKSAPSTGKTATVRPGGGHPSEPVLESPTGVKPSTGATVIPTPAAGVDDDWTHRELAEHLTKNGVRVGVAPVGLPYSAGGVPVAYLHEGASVQQPAVLVFLCRDKQHAREQAGTMGAEAFTYGRFAVAQDRAGGRTGIDDAGLLRRVSAVLKR